MSDAHDGRIRATDIVLFSIVFAISKLVPALLKAPFPPFPLAKTEDAFTLLTPLVLVPMYWLLLRRARGAPVEGRLIVAFLALTAIWVDAHGMHDAANSIGHLVNDGSSDAYRLTYFFDEEASHYLWDGGLLALSAVLVVTEFRHGGGPRTPGWMSVVAGLIYGVTCSLMLDEGQTVPIGLPFAIAFVIGSAIMLTRRRSQVRLLSFFATGYAVAALLLIAWGVYWRGFPQLSDLGLI